MDQIIQFLLYKEHYIMYLMSSIHQVRGTILCFVFRFMSESRRQSNSSISVTVLQLHTIFIYQFLVNQNNELNFDPEGNITVYRCSYNRKWRALFTLAKSFDRFMISLLYTLALSRVLVRAHRSRVKAKGTTARGLASSVKLYNY